MKNSRRPLVATSLLALLLPAYLFARLAMEPVPLLRSGASSCLADGLRPDLTIYSFP
jgi:hypothetical protein